MDFFTSDTHYGHKNILSYTDRKNHFNDLEEMGEALVANYNSRVSKDDTCYFVGDVVMGLREDNLKRYVSRLNGRKILVSGNHDYTFSGSKNLAKWLAIYGQYFDEVHDSLVLPNYFKNGTVDALLYHFPYKGAEYEDHEGSDVRYEHLRLNDEGKILLHGHTHERKHRTGATMIHVGVDAILWKYAPVSKEEIEAILGDVECPILK